MKRPRRGEIRQPERAREDAGAGLGPELPAWKAFVVQFDRETGAKPGVFAGRIEHLSSGQRARFHTRKELLAILAELLQQVGVVSQRRP